MDIAIATASTRSNGIVTRQSSHPFDETVAKLVRALGSKGIALFAQIDHSGEAAKIGMSTV